MSDLWIVAWAGEEIRDFQDAWCELGTMSSGECKPPDRSKRGGTAD